MVVVRVTWPALDDCRTGPTRLLGLYVVVLVEINAVRVPQILAFEIFVVEVEVIPRGQTVSLDTSAAPDREFLQDFEKDFLPGVAVHLARAQRVDGPGTVVGSNRLDLVDGGLGLADCATERIQGVPQDLGGCLGCGYVPGPSPAAWKRCRRSAFLATMSRPSALRSTWPVSSTIRIR